MATKQPPPKKYGTPGQAGAPRASKSTAGKAKPMPKKRFAYTTRDSMGSALGGEHGRGKGSPTSAKQVHR
jgi:hypothetical protein